MVFSNIHFLTFGMTIPLFTKKIYRVKGHFVPTTFDLGSFISSKNRIKQDHCLENAHLLSNRMKICHIFRFTKFQQIDLVTCQVIKMIS